MNLQELKKKNPLELLGFAEELEVENASSLRKQDMLFAILKQLAENDIAIFGDGVLEVLQDGFGFLRSPEANYLPGPDDIYVSPSQVRRFGLRTGDTVEGQIRSPKDGERYFALLKVKDINFSDPQDIRHRVNFDNLTPLYPDQRINMEIDDPEFKELIVEAERRIVEGGKWLGDGTLPGITPADMFARGYHFVSNASDLLLLRGAAAQAAAAR